MSKGDSDSVSGNYDEACHIPSNEPHGRDASPGHISGSEANGSSCIDGDIKFEPVDLDKTPLIDSGLPPEIWTIVQCAPANFAPQYFLDVSRNLLENPNLTASHLSRAELSYKSFTDASYNPDAKHPHELADIVKHLQAGHQPRIIPGGFPGYALEWTVVRKLIPRNPKLDAQLLQTCHLYTSAEEVTVRDKDGSCGKIEAERYLVVYLPHASDPQSIPFYHPKVRGVAILYTFQPNAPSGTAPGTLSIYYDLFPDNPLDNRMSRTALKMLEIIHKHSRGRMQGYQKRVHHDMIIPQKTFQDTYVYLKGKYAKDLIENWVEQTPANKHVFEDLGIAAFLIELWSEMYGGNPPQESDNSTKDQANVSADSSASALAIASQQRRLKAQRSFPGFVDIGCGNGLLVYILNKEGWTGWGFDARRRKTWATFGEDYQNHLKEMLLVPEILDTSDGQDEEPETVSGAPPSHNGIFPPGTFIVSNHADELTLWTPLLAHLSSSPFIAIPCCSHNFGGTRFRSPHHSGYFASSTTTSQKQPSAYASLCSYTAYLTTIMGYEWEKEHLRIPSTRNVAIIGRKRTKGEKVNGSLEDKLAFVRRIVEEEMGGDTSIEQVRLQWLKRGSGLLKPGKGGH
ncbi:DUF1613-domain-containing protein [Trematosphaeria pertusa]|uniref:tRNA (uracil-O(2)-)-methyltransferase n=1 Tax=Trematosphaeria pertusa TaxID=390896 RepID=A0A6A6J4W7_9PLEO|nr:DUF1613-domain-containing protein [Trematosphaeria pertusa]KAF2257417.1 DUF1613-domain-containing protein [Trematosphaeria pertusa]